MFRAKNFKLNMSDYAGSVPELDGHFLNLFTSIGPFTVTWSDQAGAINAHFTYKQGPQKITLTNMNGSWLIHKNCNPKIVKNFRKAVASNPVVYNEARLQEFKKSKRYYTGLTGLTIEEPNGAT